MNGLLYSTKGLSLIELLAAAFISIVILTAILPMLQIGISTWLSQSEAGAMQQDERMALDNMAREIRAAQRHTVQIAAHANNGCQMLRYTFREGANTPTHAYFKWPEGTDLWLIRTMAGSGTDPVISGLNQADGFEFAFFNPMTKARRTAVNSTLEADEVVELIIRSKRGGQDFEVRTYVSPRN